jgi:hypothetical protein
MVLNPLSIELATLFLATVEVAMSSSQVSRQDPGTAIAIGFVPSRADLPCHGGMTMPVVLIVMPIQPARAMISLQ